MGMEQGNTTYDREEYEEMLERLEELMSSSADALALPASSKQVHWSMTRDEVAQEESAA